MNKPSDGPWKCSPGQYGALDVTDDKGIPIASIVWNGGNLWNSTFKMSHTRKGPIPIVRNHIQ